MSEKICPIFSLQLAIVGQSILQITAVHPKAINELGGVIDKKDKNCIRHNCAMWNKRGKQCGLIKGEA